MAKKTFITFLLVLFATFLFCSAVEYYRPRTSSSTKFEKFPVEKGDWIGQRDDLIPAIVEMLNPTEIFSATFTNPEGIEVHLFFDYFSQMNSRGGPHSPRNCLPGSGWMILDTKEREITVDGRIIRIGRFYMSLGKLEKVMDFWYVTRYGETANDFMFKFYMMINSLTFRQIDVAFIRIIANDDEESLLALDDFENVFVEEIYQHLQFD